MGTIVVSLRAGSLVVVGPRENALRHPFAFSRGPTTTSEPARRLYCSYHPSNIFRNTRDLLKIWEYHSGIPKVGMGIFSHVT